jgi:nucleotide-binding universal stress UspA family protein
MYDRILVPTDGSRGTTETLDHAAHIAADNDATLHVLYVVDRRVYLAADDDAKADIAASMEQEGERALEAATDELADVDVPVVTERREGVPHREIIEYAEEAEIDLVTIGTHGRTGRDRLASMGSVTERVVEGVELPVLVVDIEEEE